MAEFYKLNIGEWNEGTDDLTLEQEAAYLRVVNAIRLTEQPIRFNFFVLGGLWRCNERKAKRILKELIAAGKVSIDGKSIINRRAFDDAHFTEEACDIRTAIPAAMRQAVWERDGATCIYCRDTSGPFELDHILPWSRGGEHVESNLVVSCRSCNRAKYDRTPSEMGWLQ